MLSDTHVVPKFRSRILSFEVGLTSNLEVFPLSVPMSICLSVFYSEFRDNVHLIFNKSVLIFKYQTCF